MNELLKYRVSRFFWPVCAILLASTLVLTGYWRFTYTGPYAFFADLALEYFGSFNPDSAMLSSFLCLILPLVTILIILELFLQKKGVVSFRREAGGFAHTLEKPEKFGESLIHSLRVTWEHRGFSLLICLITGGVALYFISLRVFAGSLVTINITDLYEGSGPTIQYARIDQGTALLEKTLVITEGDTQEFYAPIVPDNDTLDEIHLLGMWGDKNLSPMAPFTGVLFSHIDAFARSSMEKEYGITIAKNAWVLNMADDPTKYTFFSITLVIIFLISLVIFRRQGNR